jgi:hypothetical protein
LSNTDNAEPALSRERRSLQNQISESESAVRQLEDKLAFFKFSDDTNPLKKDLLDRIEAAKLNVDAWRKKRKQIDLMLKDIRRKEEAESAAEDSNIESQDEESSIA